MSVNLMVKKKKPPPTNGFKKGVSGNPAGRAKLTEEELDLVAACKEKTLVALGVIESIMLNGESERTRLAAALAIVERGYGKAAQEIKQDINVNHAGTIEHRSVQEVAARIAELLGRGSDSDSATPLPH